MSLIENKSLTLAENEQFIRAVSVVSTQLNTKARLGAVAQSFDPDAVDGDGDGIVQDGSPFERPAVISAMTSAAQRLGKILSKAGINKQSRAKEYHRRHSGMSAEDIARDSVPANFDEWSAQAYERLKVRKPELPELNSETTPQDIKEIARQLQEFVEPDLIWLLSPDDAEKYEADKAINKNKAFSELIEKSLDFSPQAVARNRKLVEHVLKTNPQFRELVNRHGMPTIFGIGKSMDSSHMASGFMSDQLGMGLRKFRNTKGQGRLDFATRRIGKWFMEGLMSPDVSSGKTKRWNTRSGSPEGLLIHEYGHYLSDVLKLELSPLDSSERTKKWQAWRFSVGSKWKDTFSAMGSPEWYDRYNKDRKLGGFGDVPQEVPHIETAYGESSPTEAFAEAITAVFAHDGVDSHLISEGMKELIADFLSLDPKRDIREQLTPKRAAREIIPDGFASRGAVAQINKEKDTRYGDLTDPYELVAELLGTLDGDDPVGKMVRRLQDIKDDPKSWDLLAKNGKTEDVDIPLNIRVANMEEAQLLTSVLLNDPAFADMIRRHGTPNIYFSQTDLVLKGGHDVRGVLSGGFVPDELDELFPPRIIIDLIGSTHERNLPDVPMEQQSREKVLAYGKGRAPGNITRTHLSRSDKHVIRHEGGHAIHDNLWEKQHRGEITGRRAQLIRAYSKPTWEEFYKELGRPDLWREHQRAIRAANNESTMMDSLRRLLPGSSSTPSPEIGQVDSAYAWFNPKEMFAESFSAYTSSNPYFRELLNDTMVEHLQDMLGDADNTPGDYPQPPRMADVPDEVGIPEPPAWDGFASTGEPIKSYKQLRRNYVDNIADDETFSRSQFFQNTTTDQKIDLAVPADENEWALMAWDLMFESLQIKGEVIKRLDFSDPFNPTLEDDWDAIVGGKKFLKGKLQIGGYNFAETLDVLEYQGFLLKRDKPDFSPDIVKANRDALRSTLDAFPRFRAISEQLGLPPITVMSASHQERIGIETELSQMVDQWQNGEKLPEKFNAVMPIFWDYSNSESFLSGRTWEEFIETKAVRDLLAEWKPEVDNVGGFYSPSRTISIGRSQLNGFIDGTRVDHTFTPTAGNFLVSGDSLESTILHEYGHYIDNTLYNRGKDGKKINNDIDKLFENVADHIKTEYGRTARNEFVAEIAAAVLSGSRDQEEMLSPEARRLARQIAGLPENDPVFAGRIPGKSPSEAEVLADRFGELWRRTTDGLMEPLDKERGLRSRDGVPDVLETMMDAKLRTGLNEFPPVEFEHNGRTFAIREVGDTFEIEINSRTVARASVTPGKDGLPEIDNVDVLPGYSGVAPDKDLHEMIIDHARKKYPSARAPRRARKAEVASEGFASIGPEHHDARGIDGTPGTPEYTQAIASELAAAQAEGKKVFFDYNGETREVTVTEIFEKNGFTYMKGNDALRNGEERMFRLDRVSMPKRVENPETGKAEVLKLPGKKPRRPVPIFTGRAAEIFEGAESWEDVAARLSKGRYVFFDFETTGIEENPESVDYFHPGTPVQIGLVEIVDGKVTRRWSTHVNPGRPMSIDPKTGRSWSADNLKYKDPTTGDVMPLTDEWLAQQMPLDAALKEMLEFIGPIEDTIFGGQNHPYDDDVMKRAMTDAGLDPAKWNPGGFIDSQALAQSLLDKDSDDYPRDPKKGFKTVSLGPLATWLGHDMGGGWHSADADSEASYEAFKRLVDRAALQEGQGITVRRDLFAPGGGEKEFQERLKGFEKEKSGFDWKVKKYKDQQAKISENPAAEGFASRGVGKVREFVDKRRRAKDPASWENLTPEQRDAATQASAKAAIDYLNALQDAGIDVSALRDLDRAELDAILKDLIPGGEARVSDYVTGDGKALIEVSNATMGKVFMSLGLHVQVISDDPNEQHLLENGINDMQKALQGYVSAVAKDPDALLKDRIFMDWADKNAINLGSLNNTKNLEKAAKKFAEEFEINLCLYYKSGTNMLCGANIGIQREEMPQIGGRMRGDDTLAARAIRTGLMPAKEFKIDDDKLNKLDQAKQDELRKLAKDPARVAELAKSKDPLAQELFDVLNWNDTEASVEALADRAAAALGITVEKPRLVDPATMLGAQNELQGSKVENMADGVVKAVTEAVPVLEARLGRKPTQAELMDYLVNEKKNGLFQPIISAGLPGGQIYILDGHHRWAGLLMGNKKLEAMGIDFQVQLNIKNYQTDIRSGLELGRAMQVAMGIKDAKLSGEEKFVLDPNIPELTEADFDKAIADLLDPAKLVEKIREVREGGKFRETEAADVPGGQADRLAPRQIPIQETIARINMPDPEPKSRIAGVKPQQKGYRAAGTGNGWTSIEDHINLETERGNELFETHQEYLDKGYEVAWVTHTPKEAGRYAISADQVNAFDRDEISVDPANIDSVDLTGSELVSQDGEGGYLYARRKLTPAARKLQQAIAIEEELLDEYEFGDEERMLDAYSSDGFASVGSPSPIIYISDIDIDTPAIYEEEVRLAGRKYKFRAHKEGQVYVYRGKKNIGYIDLDIGHSRVVDAWSSRSNGTRVPNSQRHSIRMVWVDEGHRRRGVANELARIAEEAYGGRVEHSSNLSPEGRAWRNNRMAEFNAPGADGFASTATMERPTMIPLDLVSGVGDMKSTKRGGKAQRDQEVVADDFYTRRPTNIAGVRVPEPQRDEMGAPIPGAPIYRESMKIGRKNYTFEVDADGIVSVYTGRKYKMVAQMNLDRGHSHIGGRNSNKKRHHIDYVQVDKKHRRKGIATAMSEMAEHAYGGQVEHSAALTTEGRKFRDADMSRRGTPGADPSPLWEALNEDGFASRGSSGLNRTANRIAGRGAVKSPGQIIGEEYLEGRLDGYHRFGGNVSNTELNMLAIYQSWKESDEPWDSFVERFPALQSMIKKEIANKEQQAAIDILEELVKAPRPTMSRGQRESSVRRVINPQMGASSIMAESIIDADAMEEQRRDLQLKKNYLAWKGSGDTWEKFVEDNPAIEKLVESERSSGKLDERIIGRLPGTETPEQRKQREEFERIIKESTDKLKPILDEATQQRKKPKEKPFDPDERLPLMANAGSEEDGFPSLEKLADLMNLDEIETTTDPTMGQLTGLINQRIATGEATFAEKLGITPEQLKQRLDEIATEINNFADRFVNDPQVRKQIKLGYKTLSYAALLLGMKGMKDYMALLNPNLSGGGDGSAAGGSSLLDLVDSVLSAGIHEALIAYGSNFANLIAAEYAAMRLVTRQKAKEMIKEIKERIEGTGQYIGTMSNEMWARLRGAWAKTRPTAPIGVPAAAKQWIVAGSSPQWAEMSWFEYQAKSRKTNDLLPTDTQRWASIAMKVGQSPELIDIATYRAGIGYGDKRIKSRDVVRVYLIAEKSLGQTIGEMSASQSTSSGQEIDGDGDGFVASSPGGPDDTPVRNEEPKPLGQLVKGNIDLTNRPTVKNSDGSISTVRSITVTEGKTAVLIPTVIRKPDGTGKVVSNNDAIKHYKRTGEHLGKFDSINNANSYAEQLHKDQAKRYVDPRITRIMAGKN